jgi:hypothetical protein
MPMSLTLIEAIAGRDKALAAGREGSRPGAADGSAARRTAPTPSPWRL